MHALSRTDDPDKWDTMGDIIDDDVLATFAVVGAPRVIAETIISRFDDVMDRLQFSAPYPHEQSMWSPIVAELASTGR